MHLSPRLKGLLNATAIRDMPPYALRRAEEIFNRSEEMAASKGLGPSSWLAPLTATTMAMTSPELMIALFHHATVRKNLEQSIAVAEFMREIGLLCIAVIGVRTPLVGLRIFHAKASRSHEQTICSWRSALLFRLMLLGRLLSSRHDMHTSKM